MATWQARAFGLPLPDSSAVVHLFGTSNDLTLARQIMYRHLRFLGQEAWGNALHLVNDDEAYDRHYRNSKRLFAMAEAFDLGVSAIEFEGTRYELYSF